MPIPVVIFHIRGNQDYFISCVTETSKNNQVYLIGDDSNKTTFAANPNVKFFHVNELESNLADKFKECFVNFSGNSTIRELLCFLRIFYIKALFDKTKLDWLFHTDSDCVILENVNDVFGEHPRISYSLQKMENEFHMVGSIHNALLNVEFCDKFIELCFDIYGNKSKFNLIGKKLNWHIANDVPGGICDMTLYYLLVSENILTNVRDLNEPGLFKGNNVIFDHNISDSYGYNGEQTYVKQNGIKVLSKNENKFYFTEVDGNQIQTLSIHFQGRSNMFLPNFSI